MNEVKLEGLSVNMDYMFTNKGVLKMSYDLKDLNGRNYVPYTYEHLNIALNILKENIQHNYTIGKLNLQEYSSEPRKFLNFLMETFQPKNGLSIIKEWENKFGNKLLLINESVDSLIIESRINESWLGIESIISEGFLDWAGDKLSGAKDWVVDKAKGAVQWGKDQAKQIKDKGLVGYVKDKASQVWNYVKDKIAAAWNCVKSGVECIMEGIRKLATSAIGAAALAGIQFIPVVGQVSNAIIFGSLLLWDLYKMATGKPWNWFDIIIDAIALLTPALARVFKTAVVGIKSFAQFGAAAVSKGGILAKVFNLFKSGLNTLGGYISKAATWLGEKLGITSLSNWGKNATAQLTKVSDEMVAGGKGVKGAAGAKVSTNITKTGAAKTLSSAEQAEYNKLLSSWKAQQKALGKNATPGQGTRANLMKQAQQNTAKPAGFAQKTKDIWKGTTAKSLVVSPATSPATLFNVTTSVGTTLAVTSALCGALGLNALTCQAKVQSGEVSEKELLAAQEKAKTQVSQGMDTAIQNVGIENLNWEM
jgi:hypothetical protein